MRDLDKKPYSADEKRIAEFFFEKGAGGGDDPIGFIMASYDYLVAQRKELRKQLGDARALLASSAAVMFDGPVKENVRRFLLSDDHDDDAF